MAEQRDDIEVVEEKGGNKAKWLIAVIALLLLAIIGLGVMMLMGGDKEESGNTKQEAVAKQTPIYYTVDAPFIVNFSEQSNGAVKYLQVKMKVMARDQRVIDAFTLHLPALQHELLMLFYSQNYDDLVTADGTKALQQACLDTINQILKAESSLENELEAVYFTSFIMQ